MCPLFFSHLVVFICLLHPLLNILVFYTAQYPPFFGVSMVSAKSLSLFIIISASGMIFIEFWNCHHMKNNMMYIIARNNTLHQWIVYSEPQRNCSKLWESYEALQINCIRFRHLFFLHCRWDMHIDLTLIVPFCLPYLHVSRELYANFKYPLNQ